MTNIQYLTDNQGEVTSVIIPVSDWNRLSKLVEQMDALDDITNSIKSGLVEAKKMEAEQIESTESVNDFLDAL